MRDFTDDLRALRDRVAEAHRYLRIDAGRARLAELEVAVAAPDLWDDQDRAKQLDRRVRGRQGRPRHLRRAGARRWRTSRSSTSWPGRRATRARSPRSRPASPTLAGQARRSWSCAASSPASTTRPTPSVGSTPRTAGSTRRTGPRCCCGCTAGGASGAASTSPSTTSPRGPRPASSRPSSPSRAATPTG